MTYAVIPLLDSALIQFDSQQLAVLHGLQMRNPDRTLSEMVCIGLEKFCCENQEAAGETMIYVETNGRVQAPE